MAAAPFTTSLISGERAVVLLFISRILYSLPPGSFSAPSLCLLFFSPCWCSYPEDSHSLRFNFKCPAIPRLGSFLLGCKVCFCFVFVLQAVVRIVALSAASQSGSAAVLKLSWVFFHGLAAVKLLQHFLTTFPSCAAIGEAFLVTAGIILYFGDMLLPTITKLCRLLVSSELVTAEYEINHSEISIIIQAEFYAPPVSRICITLYREKLVIAEIESDSTRFRVPDASVVKPCLGLLKYNYEGSLRVLSFVFSEPFKRLSLCIYWLCIICVLVVRCYNISKNSKIERILLRKYYHLMAVLMFSPALIFQPKFLDLAFGAALAVFLILEIVRVWRIWPLGQPIHQFMNAFTDHHDSDLLIVSHFSLSLGGALPIWMSSGYNDRPLAPLAGILSLGIGDTMLSHLPKKTIEGTAAGIMSVLAACTLLLPLLASTGYILTQHWFSLLLAVTVSGLLEAYTAQLDNAFIPLFFYSLLCL